MKGNFNGLRQPSRLAGNRPGYLAFISFCRLFTLLYLAAAVYFALGYCAVSSSCNLRYPAQPAVIIKSST